MKKFDVIIVAAGKGRRFGRPKQFIELFGRPLLFYTVLKFLKFKEIEKIILVLPEDTIKEGHFDFKTLDDRILQVVGGKERTDSVANGLKLVSSDFVLVHDGARPLVSTSLIQKVMKKLVEGFECVVPVIPARDTMKKSTEFGYVKGIVDRTDVMQVQTPQGFRSDTLKEAYRIASKKSLKATDDSTLVEQTLGKLSYAVEGDPQNLKVTYPNDLEFVKNNLFQRIAVGHGYDIHRLVNGRKFVLGGVHFEDVSLGPLGHSDGDALIHAVIDSLLSPCGLGDIGKLFPDTDPKYKDIASVKLLKSVSKLLLEKGCVPLSIDATVILQKPKIGPKTGEMVRVMADVLNVSPEIISVKGKTAEGLGVVGKGEAVEVHAVSLIGIVQ